MNDFGSVASMQGLGDACHKELSALWLECFFLDEVITEITTFKQVQDDVEVLGILKGIVDISNEFTGLIIAVNHPQKMQLIIN